MDSEINNMNPQNVIDEFFLPEKDGHSEANGNSKRSVLLALQEDFKFSILLPGKWRSLKLDVDQHKLLKEMMPTFAVISLFCTAIDVLARIDKKRVPGRGMNSIFFKDCAIKWFGLSNSDASELWGLRNGISHNYKLQKKQAAVQYGYGGIMQKSDKGIYIFYLNAMYSRFDQARREMYDSLSKESDSDKSKTAKYLVKHGFFYVRLPSRP